jgi:hypothetical protein
MNQGYTTIPFKTDSGMSTVNGAAKFSNAGIIVEFESKLFGLISNGVKEARLPVDELLSIKFKKGVLKRGAKIEIRLKSFTRLSELPNTEGKVILKIFPDDFEAARDAVERLQKAMAEHTASLPPPHPPLRSLFDESEDETRDLNDR